MNYCNFYGYNSVYNLVQTATPIATPSMEFVASTGVPSAYPVQIPTFSVSPCNFQALQPDPTVTKSVNAGDCGVCTASAAVGIRTEAPVCIRCKSFFRRYVRKDRSPAGQMPPFCPGSGLRLKVPSQINCDLTKTRSACQACRYAACLALGLKPSSVGPERSRTRSESGSLSSDVSSPCPAPAVAEDSSTPSSPEAALPHSVLLLKKVEEPKPKRSTDVPKDTRLMHYNEQWKTQMGPFLKSRQIGTQLAEQQRRSIVILGRCADRIVQITPRYLPCTELEQQRLKKSAVIAAKMINSKVPSSDRSRRKTKCQKKVEETVRKGQMMAYRELQKVRNQNYIQREINSIQPPPPTPITKSSNRELKRLQERIDINDLIRYNDDPPPNAGVKQEVQNFVVEFDADGHVTLQQRPPLRDAPLEEEVPPVQNDAGDEYLFPPDVFPPESDWNLDVNFESMSEKLAYLEELDI